MENQKESSRRFSIPFYRLWAGETVSYFGAQISSLALPLTAILVLNADAETLGILGACQMGPFLGFPLLAGVIADRRRRKPLATVSNFGRAALLGCIPLLFALGRLQMIDMYIIGIGIGLLTVLFDSAFWALVPFVVPKEELARGNSRLLVSSSSAATVGPGLSAWLVAVITAPFALLANVGAYLAAGLNLWTLTVDEGEVINPDGHQSVLLQIRDGLKVVFGSKYLRAAAIHAAAFNFFGQFFEVLLILYVVRDLHVPVTVLGLIIAGSGFGSIAGSALTARADSRFGFGRAYVFPIVVEGVATLLVPLAAGSLVQTSLLISFGLMIQGFGVAMSSVFSITLRQTLLAPSILARGMASYRILSFGALPLGSLVGGFLGAAVGIQTTLLLGALGMCIAPLVVIASPIFRMKKADDFAGTQGDSRNRGNTLGGIAVVGLKRKSAWWESHKTTAESFLPFNAGGPDIR